MMSLHGGITAHIFFLEGNHRVVLHSKRTSETCSLLSPCQSLREVGVNGRLSVAEKLQKWFDAVLKLSVHLTSSSDASLLQSLQVDSEVRLGLGKCYI